MAKVTSRRTAIVADRRPLERGLARFLLEERGLFVVGEAATMADVLLQIQQLKPDIVVLHEKLALDHDPTVTAQIRRVSARTSIVLLAASREALPPELIMLADAVVEDGPGLSELGAAVAGPESTTDAASAAEAVVAEAPVIAPPAPASGRRWADRLQGLAVASIIALAFLLARGDLTGPSVEPTAAAQVRLTAAWDSLDALEDALPTASSEEIAEIAASLVEERARAIQAGADISSLDQAVLDALASIWPYLSPETQGFLIAILGDVFADNDEQIPPVPSPSPEPPPAPGPTPEAEPTSSPPEPSATDPPVPTTTEPVPTTTEPVPTTTEPVPTTTEPVPTTTEPVPTTTEPVPTTTEPVPTTTEPVPTTTEPVPTTTEPVPTTTEPVPTTTEPVPTTTEPPPRQGETQTGLLVVMPFMLSLLVAVSGWARRRSRRSSEGHDEIRRR